jgi:hypothetical protein
VSSRQDLDSGAADGVLRFAMTRMRLHVLGIAILAFFAPACGIRRPVPGSDRSGRVIALRYDETLAAIGFPNPLLRVTINGRRVWFIVDTGAGVHTIASWLVDAARIPTRASKGSVTGSTGAEQRVRAIGALRARLDDGRALSIPEGIVVDLPAVFKEHEIGGLLSPQLLTTRDAVVLDLTVPAMTFEPFPTAIARVRREGDEVAADARVCHNADSAFRNRLYAAPAIAAGIPGTLLVDTGATRTIAAPESRIGRQIGAQSIDGMRTQGVGGNVTSSRRIPHVTIMAGGMTTAIDLTLGTVAGTCSPDGLLGMDLLRRCVLVLGESAFAWSCKSGD